MKNNKAGSVDGAIVLGFIALIILIIWLGPIIAIWAANVLLSAIGIATIPFTLKTWFAMLLLVIFFSGTGGK